MRRKCCASPSRLKTTGGKPTLSDFPESNLTVNTQPSELGAPASELNDQQAESPNDLTTQSPSTITSTSTSTTQPPTPNAQPPTPNPVASTAERLFSEMHKAVVGQDELVEMLVVALLASGHV